MTIAQEYQVHLGIIKWQPGGPKWLAHFIPPLLIHFAD
jgi:hypothetical protein